MRLTCSLESASSRRSPPSVSGLGSCSRLAPTFPAPKPVRTKANLWSGTGMRTSRAVSSAASQSACDKAAAHLSSSCFFTVRLTVDTIAGEAWTSVEGPTCGVDGLLRGQPDPDLIGIGAKTRIFSRSRPNRDRDFKSRPFSRPNRGGAGRDSGIWGSGGKATRARSALARNWQRPAAARPPLAVTGAGAAGPVGLARGTSLASARTRRLGRGDPLTGPGH